MSEKSGNVKLIHVDEPAPGKFGKMELYALSIGQVIGAGIITLIGPAVGLTGGSTWLAYLTAIALGFLLIMPILFITSTLRLGGGYYSLIAGLGGTKLAGMYAVAFLTQCISCSLFGTSLGMYAQSIFPAVNPKLVGIFFLTLFYVLNLMGANIMAKVQKFMLWILLAALLMFIVLGIPHVKNPIFTFSDPSFFSNGSNGFIAAVYLFVYSTYGYSMTMNYGREAKNAKRDIPWAILMSIPTLIVLYCGVAIVGSGVLPYEEVIGKPLTVVAQAVLPGPLFVLFIIGGPIIALMTTMNSYMAYCVIPLKQATDDGWFPKWLGTRNRFGVAWKILTIIFLIGLLPMIFNFDVSMITKNIMLFNSILSFIYAYAYWQLPKKYPDAWAKSRFHMPDRMYYVMVIISTLAYVTVFFDALRSLTPIVGVLSVGFALLCIAYSILRGKTAEITIETSMWG